MNTTNTGKQKCIYCGKQTESKKFILNPKARHELPSCSAECLNEAKEFLKMDTVNRRTFYLLELVFIIANIIMFGMKIISRWSFIPMIGMGAILYMYPIPFTRYESYQTLGIKKTVILVRYFAIFLVVLSLTMIFVSK